MYKILNSSLCVVFNSSVFANIEDIQNFYEMLDIISYKVS